MISARVSKNENSINLEFELSGVPQDQVKVYFKDDCLFVEGNKVKLNENYQLNEIPFGTYKRKIRIPKNYDVKSIKANYKDGILNVSMNEIKSEIIEVKIN